MIQSYLVYILFDNVATEPKKKEAKVREADTDPGSNFCESN